jgi:hypothetical protein
LEAIAGMAAAGKRVGMPTPSSNMAMEPVSAARVKSLLAENFAFASMRDRRLRRRADRNPYFDA